MKIQNLVITGGSTGIGAATAKQAIDQGLNVYNLDIQPSDFEHEKLQTIECDVADYNDVADAIDFILATEKRIDGLFANAGIHIYASIEETTLEAMNRVLDVNFKGVFHVLKSVIPHMRAQQFGRIVLTGSDQSFVGKSGSAIYGATKGAIAQLTKSTAIDYAKDNIRINCICPGTIETPLLEKTVRHFSEKAHVSVDSIYDALKTAQPMPRLGQPEEIAQAVWFLLSEHASFITGALISADGGYTSQ